jgi:hypothetical protein
MDGSISPRFDWSGYGVDGDKFRSQPLVKVLEATIETGDVLFGSATAGILCLSGPLLRLGLVSESPKTHKSMIAGERKANLTRLMAEVEPEFSEANTVSLMISDDDIPDATNMDIDVVNGVLSMDSSEITPTSKMGPSSGRDFKLSLGQHQAKVCLDERFDFHAGPQKDLF